MASDAIKNTFSLTFATDLADNFNNDSDDQYFLILGKIDTWVNPPYGEASDVAAANTDTLEKSNYAWRDGIGLKRISSRNIYHMIPRYDWTYTTVYDEYDHTVDMFNATSVKKFFVYTSSGNVYKCIDNNGGGESLYEPDHTLTAITTYNDGYKWKFIYKVTEDSRDFISTTYIPVQLAPSSSTVYAKQWNVQQEATKGSIDSVATTIVDTSAVHGGAGVGWTAAEWVRSRPIGGGTDLTVGESSYVGDTFVALNLGDHNTSDNYFKGYSIYVSSGPGQGQKRPITSYTQGNNRVSFTDPLIEDVLVSNHDGAGSLGSSYKIVPNVIFDGDGVSADGYPVLHDGGYTLKDISMINGGSNYTIADVQIWPKTVSGGNIDDVVDTTDGNLRGPTFSAIIPPEGGHGSNALKEFNSSKIMIRTTIGALDSNFTTAQDFRQLTIVKNPLWRGGTNDGNVLGTEILRKKQLTVRKPYFGTSFNDQAFVSGNSVMGETSKATGKIESWNSEANNTSVGTLELSNVQGKFDYDDPSSVSTRIVFDDDSPGNTGDLIVGKILKQTNGTLVASGIIKSWSAPSGGPYETIIDVTSNAFTNGVNSFSMYDTDEEGGGESVPNINWSTSTVVERKMGELLKHYSSSQGVDFSFIDFNNYQNVARANSFTDVQDSDILEKSYSLATKLIITSSADDLTSNTFLKDDIFYQIDVDTGVTGSIKTGKVMDWNTLPESGGTTGELSINDVRGAFIAGGISGDGNHSISSITAPNVKIGSGEVLYIQNMAPITRNVAQDEEIKILIGF